MANTSSNDYGRQRSELASKYSVPCKTYPFDVAIRDFAAGKQTLWSHHESTILVKRGAG